MKNQEIGFVDGIWDWEGQSLVCMHSCENITAALAYVLKVEAAGIATHRPVLVQQRRDEYPKKQKLSSNKEVRSRTPT